MGSKMKGIYKGFKYSLTQLFGSKEREMEIGNPTDVKHIAHIGWDGPSGSSAPSWMNEFKAGQDFPSCGRSALPPWPSSQDDFERSMQQHHRGFETGADLVDDLEKKTTGRKKKSLSSSSPRFFSSSFPGKAKSKMCRDGSRILRRQASLDV
ncbi:hypothetical protein M569_05741 [Genlisea aurea]|uniref:CRIB domain-containing protein n=1 Tax=Genlisea aurea TaxID=192259 RepID=S8CQK9_9LAMI|nr:hypothetical protein M569_05741 [Genlisea aurea]